MGRCPALPPGPPAGREIIPGTGLAVVREKVGFAGRGVEGFAGRGVDGGVDGFAGRGAVGATDERWLAGACRGGAVLAGIRAGEDVVTMRGIGVDGAGGGGAGLRIAAPGGTSRGPFCVLFCVRFGAPSRDPLLEPEVGGRAFDSDMKASCGG